MRSPVGRASAGNSVGRPVRPGLELEDKNVIIPRFHIEARDRDDQVLLPLEIEIRFHRFEPCDRLGSIAMNVVEGHATERPVWRHERPAWPDASSPVGRIDVLITQV